MGFPVFLTPIVSQDEYQGWKKVVARGDDCRLKKKNRSIFHTYLRLIKTKLRYGFRLSFAIFHKKKNAFLYLLLNFWFSTLLHSIFQCCIAVLFTEFTWVILILIYVAWIIWSWWWINYTYFTKSKRYYFYLKDW